MSSSTSKQTEAAQPAVTSLRFEALGAVQIAGDGTPGAGAGDAPAVAADREGFRLWYNAEVGSDLSICMLESPSAQSWAGQGTPLFGARPPCPNRVIRDPFPLFHQRLWYLWYTAADRPDGAAPPPASIWACTAPDGHTWLGHAAALEPGDDFDRVAVAEPSVVRDPDGPWLMAYAGSDGQVWRIGLAQSVDLLHWKRTGMILEPWGDAVMACKTPRLVRWNSGWLLVMSVEVGGQWSVFGTTSPDTVWWSTPMPLALPALHGECGGMRGAFPLWRDGDLYLYYACLTAGAWHIRAAVARNCG